MLLWRLRIQIAVQSTIGSYILEKLLLEVEELDVKYGIPQEEREEICKSNEDIPQEKKTRSYLNLSYQKV